MTKTNSTPDQRNDTRIGKKSYEKPTFQYEDVFVTSALSCAKAIDQSTCMFQSPKSS
jgi:hypothetical protein